MAPGNISALDFSLDILVIKTKNMFCFDKEYNQYVCVLN